MKRNRFTEEQIIGILREKETVLANARHVSRAKKPQQGIALPF